MDGLSSAWLRKRSLRYDRQQALIIILQVFDCKNLKLIPRLEKICCFHLRCWNDAFVCEISVKVAYYSFIRVQEVYTTNVQI